MAAHRRSVAQGEAGGRREADRPAGFGESDTPTRYFGMCKV